MGRKLIIKKRDPKNTQRTIPTQFTVAAHGTKLRLLVSVSNISILKSIADHTESRKTISLKDAVRLAYQNPAFETVFSKRIWAAEHLVQLTEYETIKEINTVLRLEFYFLLLQEAKKLIEEIQLVIEIEDGLKKLLSEINTADVNKLLMEQIEILLENLKKLLALYEERILVLDENINRLKDRIEQRQSALSKIDTGINEMIKIKMQHVYTGDMAEYSAQNCIGRDGAAVSKVIVDRDKYKYDYAMAVKEKSLLSGRVSNLSNEERENIIMNRLCSDNLNVPRVYFEQNSSFVKRVATSDKINNASYEVFNVINDQEINEGCKVRENEFVLLNQDKSELDRCMKEKQTIIGKKNQAKETLTDLIRGLGNAKAQPDNLDIGFIEGLISKTSNKLQLDKLGDQGFSLFNDHPNTNVNNSCSGGSTSNILSPLGSGTPSLDSMLAGLGFDESALSISNSDNRNDTREPANDKKLESYFSQHMKR